MHRVVVTGIGVVSPNGIGCREFREAIFEGRSGVGYIESFDTTGMRSGSPARLAISTCCPTCMITRRMRS